ncbi:MAG: DNA translocase FtsK [Dehalococcoidia bacterium]
MARDWLARPQLIGTALVVLAAAALPFLLPIGHLLGGLRDSLVRTFGVHVFTIVLALLTFGALLATQRTEWLRLHARHVAGFLLMLVFSAGVLAVWRPDQMVGSADLGVVSAGGNLGRWFLGWPGFLVWLAVFASAFSLLWPVTALAIARATPGIVALGVMAASRWAWNGLRRRVEGPPSDVDTALEYDEYEVDVAPSIEPAFTPDLDVGTPIEKPAVEVPSAKRQLEMDLEQPADRWRHSGDGWQLPAIELLDEGKPSKMADAERQQRAQLIVDTLASFGVDARVVEVNAGPTVTQFGIEPGWDVRTRTVQERDANGQTILDSDGRPRTKEVEVSRTRIRVNRIIALQNDLALAMAAPALRIEAPVPGKPIVGIEVPNESASVVSMRSVLSTPEYRRFAAKADMPVALGSSVSGEPVLADLAKMPHLLIAGATGSGKSVCLNAIITCLLMNFSPEELRLVLIDPKRVELTPYEKVPHLAFSNIIVDMDRVVGTLQAVINEMESRYRRFAQVGVRDIKRYNEQAAKRGQSKLPYWAVIVDELADLMLVAPYQVENQIVRLAQLARATGIHLVIATQRPSVDVVTGLIKANFPTRIAFAVASQVDSRTVLDRSGAEKLLGRGDMLYVPTDAQTPRRVQGVYLSDREIEAVIRFWTADRFKELAPPKHDDLLDEAEEQVQGGDEADPDSDPLYDRAVALAREMSTLSTSMLQRRLRIGYPRAARIIDELEERGVIGPADGSTSREVLIRDEARGVPVGGPPAEASTVPPAGDGD